MNERILIIEDDQAILKILQRGLAYEGYTVDTATEGRSGLMLARDHQPDLVILDWMMPRVDGPMLCRRMRERPETRDLPVVFITAKASPRELDELRALGAAGTISKPFSPTDLPDQLRAIWNALPAQRASYS